MAEDKSDLMLRLFSEAWQKSVNDKEWHSAVLVAMGAYLYFTVEKNDQYRGGTLGLITAAFQLQDLSTSDRDKSKIICSFCGKDQSQVRLGAGPSAHICENCVRMFSEIFSKHRDDDKSDQ
jgi:hypothetical protein